MITIPTTYNEDLTAGYVDFITNLKVGDTVAIRSTNPPGVGIPYFIVKIDAIDSSRFFLRNEWSEIVADRLSGRMHYSSRYIEPITIEIEEAVAAADLAAWCALSLPTAVAALSTDRRQAVRDLVERLTVEQAKEVRGE